MIQANELRIGNLLLQHGEPKKCSIITLHSMLAGINMPKGLPITHDWLIKLGFLTGNTIDTYYRNDMGTMYLKLPHRDSKHYLIKAAGDVAITSVKHIHQLQNFYYSVCGQELTL